MFRKILLIIFIFSLNKIAIAKEDEFLVDDLFYIDQMNSYNKNFALYFKGREKSILARGETSNYINDFPKDLYIYDYKTKSSSPLISYEWFPKKAKSISKLELVPYDMGFCTIPTRANSLPVIKSGFPVSFSILAYIREFFAPNSRYISAP